MKMINSINTQKIKHTLDTQGMKLIKKFLASEKGIEVRYLTKYLKEILDGNVSIDKDDELLMYLVQEGEYELVKKFIDAGYDELTHLIDESDNIEFIEYLLSKGADINEVSLIADRLEEYEYNRNPNISYISMLENLKSLLELGANPSLANSRGEIPLMALIRPLAGLRLELEGDDDTYTLDNIKAFANLLLDYGADIDGKDSIGMTTLMLSSLNTNMDLVHLLLDRGADINAKSEMTAFDLASNDEVKKMLQETKNTNPQHLVKLLSNFTIDKPVKYTTHFWDFGELKYEYRNFDAYLEAVKKQFLNMKNDLKTLSPNLHKKIYTFLLETNPDSSYSWCNKINTSIGWSSLEGLREHCDNGGNAFDFKLKEYIVIKKGISKETITTFGGVINLFKQEIEIRIDFKNLETIFNEVKKSLPDNKFKFDIKNSKLQRQFYTDTQSFNSAIKKIFAEITKRTEHSDIELITQELADRSLEIKIVQIGSTSSKDSLTLLNEVNDGDFADIRTLFSNLCDWSIESSCEDGNFRINYLHSTNVKQIVKLEEKTKGFTHILRFYR